MDPLLYDYLEHCIDVLTSAGSYSMEEGAIRYLSESLAIMRVTLKFYGGSYLSAQMRVGLVRNRPLLIRYSFHYMAADDSTIFRYDNARHHHGLEHFPHHKHIGESERVIDCPQPTIRQIRDEIAACLEEQETAE